MEVTPRSFFALAFICLNFGHYNVNVGAELLTQEGFRAFTSSSPAASSPAIKQQKPLQSLLRADNLDLAAVAEGDKSLAGVETAAAVYGESLRRQKRQFILPYSTYGRYYNNYPYVYPYDSSYYYLPYNGDITSYGFPFFLYG